MLFPFVWLVITSFSTLDETRTFPPSSFRTSLSTWHNYVDAWTDGALRALVLQHGARHR